MLDRAPLDSPSGEYSRRPGVQASSGKFQGGQGRGNFRCMSQTTTTTTTTKPRMRMRTTHTERRGKESRTTGVGLRRIERCALISAYVTGGWV